MRALMLEAYGPIDSHAIKDVPAPAPGPGEVLIRARAIGINFPDALMLQGLYQKRPEPPFVPGRDVAGTIEAVGEGVRDFAPGDRVMAQVFSGAFAELVPAPLKRVFPLPADMPFEAAAAMITVFNTAYVAVHMRARVEAGKVALVTGAAGGVGLAAVQLLKAAGVTVIALVSSEDKAALVREYGADHVVRSDVADLRDHLKESVLDLTAGQGADYVFETIGGAVFAAALRVLGFDGRMVVIGFASADIPQVKTNYLLYRNLSVMGAPLDIQFDHRYEELKAGIAYMHRLYLDGRIRPSIMKTLPLEDFKEAFALITGRQVRGKVVLTVDG